MFDLSAITEILCQTSTAALQMHSAATAAGCTARQYSSTVCTAVVLYLVLYRGGSAAAVISYSSLAVQEDRT
jgi:hypothetical protein